MNWRTYVNLKVGKSYRKYDVIKRGKRFQLLNRISLRPLR